MTVKGYLAVFLALGVLTMLTVGVAYLDLPKTTSIVLAAVIALTKVSLIGMFFMHLISERKLIHYIWVTAVIFVSVLVMLVYPDLVDR